MDRDKTPTNSPYYDYGSVSDTSSNPSTPRSVSSNGSGGARQPRQRLRPWLIDQINSGDIPGLEWLDKDDLSFKIPWKHFGRPGINEYEDALLFRRWALHTKKFKEGENADISTWKTRFRCALHKLPDIEELHNCNQKDGDNPYRVYRFIKKEIEVEKAPCCQSAGCSNPPPVDQKPFIGNEIKHSPSPRPSPHPHQPQLNHNINPHAVHKNPVWMSPSQELQLPPKVGADVVDDELMLQDFGEDALSSLDVDNILVEDIMQTPCNNNYLDQYNQYPVMGNHHRPGAHDSSLSQTIETLSSVNSLQNINSISNSCINDHYDQLNAVEIKLYYAEREVALKVVDNPNGLRIAFNPPPPLPQDVVQEDAAQFVSHIYGPLHAEQIYFPQTEDPHTIKILECIRRGLVLQARNGQVLATRLCRAKVFYSDSAVSCDNELPREHTIVVFDFANEFIPKLRRFMLGEGPSPVYERYFSFAQKWNEHVPLANNCVRVTVTHCLAQKKFNDCQKEKYEILISEPNALDVIAQQIDGLNLQEPN